MSVEFPESQSLDNRISLAKWQEEKNGEAKQEAGKGDI